MLLAACCMPQRMLHLLHVVTAFMAKWLTGHGRLFLRPRLGCAEPTASSKPDPESDPDRPAVVPFAVACHVQAIRMFQKCFGHGSFWRCSVPVVVSVVCVSVSVSLVHLAVIIAAGSWRWLRSRGWPRRSCRRSWPHTCVRT